MVMQRNKTTTPADAGRSAGVVTWSLPIFRKHSEGQRSPRLSLVSEASVAAMETNPNGAGTIRTMAIKQLAQKQIGAVAELLGALPGGFRVSGYEPGKFAPFRQPATLPCG